MTSIVAIVEGVEVSLLRKLVQASQLPFFSKAFNEFAYAPLNAGPIPYEPSHLTSAFTGSLPEHHGCYSYWDIHDIKDEKPRVLTSTDVKLPRLWQWDSFSRYTFSIINIALTHPPQPLNGYLLSYLMNQTLHASYPTKLQHELNREGVRYAHDVSAFYRGENEDQFVSKIFKIAQYQLDTALHLATKCDILIFNLTIADRLSHFYWGQLKNNTINEELPVIKSYIFLDKALAKLETKIQRNDFMLVFSEIGFGNLDYFVSVDDYLLYNRMIINDNTGNIISEKSTAREAVQGSHGVNIITSEKNIYKRRETAEYRDKLDTTIHALKSFKFKDNNPVFDQVVPSEDFFTHGKYLIYAPDLITIPSNLNRPPLGDKRWAHHVNRTLQTGWHRPDGFCFYHGSSLPIKHLAETCHINQIAPTIAYLCKCQVPSFCNNETIFFGHVTRQQ